MKTEVYAFKEYAKKTTIRAAQIDKPFVVETLEGRMVGKAGDYLAIGANGEKYPIDKRVFEKTYEEVKG